MQAGKFFIVYKCPVCPVCLNKNDLQAQDGQRSVSCDPESIACETTVDTRTQQSPITDKYQVCLECEDEDDLQTQDGQRSVSCLCDSKPIPPGLTHKMGSMFMIYKQQMCRECMDEDIRADVKDMIARHLL